MLQNDIVCKTTSCENVNCKEVNCPERHEIERRERENIVFERRGQYEIERGEFRATIETLSMCRRVSTLIGMLIE